MRDCRECGGTVEARFHYCPWCAAPQRRKLVEFFRPHDELESDQGKALRVSRYFGRTKPERHVRLSVWNESGSAEAAVSLDEGEAQRLAEYVVATGPPRAPRPSLLGTVLSLAGGGRYRERRESLAKGRGDRPDAYDIVGTETTAVDVDLGETPRPGRRWQRDHQ